MDDPHIAMIQRNAIGSWLRLQPQPRIILFGSEHGVAELAEEMGVQHIIEVERSELGTPLVRSVFERAAAESDAPVLVYCNCDIIVMQDLVGAIAKCKTTFERFMLGARPWDLAICEPLEFSEGWQERLKQVVLERGKLRGEKACDIFAYSRGLWGTLPTLVIGRSWFDNALMSLCRKVGGALIDGIPGVMVVHQRHSYSPTVSGAYEHSNPEAEHNFTVGGGPLMMFGWKNASHRFDGTRIKKQWRNMFRSLVFPQRVRIWCRLNIWFMLLKRTKRLRMILAEVMR